MKKYQLVIGAFVLMLGTAVYAKDMSIYISNKNIKMDVAPQVKENVTYVPISFISKELGEHVEWEKPRIIITKSPHQFIFTIGDQTVNKNSHPIQLVAAPYLSNNRTFVPLREVSQLLNWDVEYQKESKSIHINPTSEDDMNQLVVNELNIPQLTLLNHNSNYVTLPRYWNGQTHTTQSTYKAVLTNNEATTNIYRPRVNEVFKFHFREIEPDQVTVRMAYTTDNSIEAPDLPTEVVSVTKNGDVYEFVHEPITAPDYTYGGRIYSIEAKWGNNTCEYAFLVDNKWNLLAHEKLAEKMKSLHALDYCVVGNWVYYAVLGDQEGFHKMLLDGTQDTIICDFSNVVSVGGSIAVTSEYKGDYILYKMQSLREYDENGELGPPQPAYYYKLNLSNNTLTVFLND